MFRATEPKQYMTLRQYIPGTQLTPVLIEVIQVLGIVYNIRNPLHRAANACAKTEYLSSDPPNEIPVAEVLKSRLSIYHQHGHLGLCHLLSLALLCKELVLYKLKLLKRACTS